tara:strand:+ start:51 stop:1466 length:1416 start_codon:yes stop_codon:yes gene_type:complete
MSIPATRLVVAIRSPLWAKDRREAIRKTWGGAFKEHGVEVFFIVSGEDTSIVPVAPWTNFDMRGDVLYTPGTDQHRDLSNRMCWLWRYVEFNCNYTHLLVMDDDCSVNVPLFMTLPWGEADAWGHNNGGFLSGSAAVFSQHAINKLDYFMTLDDVVIGLLLNREGIKLTSSENFIRPWLPPGQETLWNPGNADIAIQHYTREVKDIIENFNRINLPYKQKVLACLVNHGTEQIKYLQQVVKELKSFKKYDVNIVVNSNIPLDIEEIDVVNVIDPDPGQHLLLTCRKELWNRKDEFDIFIYGENDHLIKEKHLDNHIEYVKIIPGDKITGLIQFEEDKTGIYYPGYHEHYDWDFNSVEEYDGRRFASFTNLHQATFILTKDQLHRIGDKFNFIDFFGDTSYDHMCRVNTDIYECGIFKKIICISEFKENLIHHLPNLYIHGDKGRHKYGAYCAPDIKMKDSLIKLLSTRLDS